MKTFALKNLDFEGSENLTEELIQFSERLTQFVSAINELYGQYFMVDFIQNAQQELTTYFLIAVEFCQLVERYEGTDSKEKMDELNQKFKELEQKMTLIENRLVFEL